VANLKKVGKLGLVTLMMIFLVIALLFSIFRFSLPGMPAIPLEVSPHQKTEISILKQFSTKSLIFGSGPATFIYDWSKQKPADVNQTVFWAARFQKGASEFLDRILTTGILGVLALFFLIFVFFKKAFKFLVGRMGDKAVKNKVSGGANWFLVLGIIACFAGLVFTFFLYPANFPTLLLLWLLISVMALLETEERKVFVIDTSPAKALAFSFAFVLILVLQIGFSIVYFQKYIAEVKYFQGTRAFQEGDNVLAVNFLSQAVKLNPQMDIYWRDLSQVYLIRLNEVLNATDLAPENKSSQAQALVVSAVNSATQATILNPIDVAGWNVRGFVYRNLIGILGGADNWAIKSYETAIDLEPTSPYIFTEIGRIYIVKANLALQQGDSLARDENITLAKTFFEKAISLKADYAPANYQIAAIYVDAGKTEEAINSLLSAQQAAPLDIGLAFQLGVIYYGEEQFDNAKVQFERAVALDPNYSNARYFLGLIYDQQWNKNDAISQFEIIEELNPENQEVKKILSNLREGKPALEGVVQLEPPVQEKSPEGSEK
jgi:tetratricopeptide (TPR) repeat protein